MTNQIILALTVTTPVQTTTMYFTQKNANADHATLIIKLRKLLDKHLYLKTQNQNLKILKTPP